MNKEEMIKKAAGAATPEELLAMAQEAGQELKPEQAEEIFSRLHKGEGELADEELDNVAGGCGHDCGHHSVDWSVPCDRPSCEHRSSPGVTICSECAHFVKWADEVGPDGGCFWDHNTYHC